MELLQNKLKKICEMGREGGILCLLEQGASVNYCDEYGVTPLQVAAANGNHNVLNLLIMQGADVTKSNIFGWTPLMHAARNGHISIVKKLLDYGADISQRSKLGTNLLCLAVASGNLSIVSILLERSLKESNLFMWQDNNISPVCMAAMFGHAHLILLLINNDMTDSSGLTALKLASLRGHGSVVQMLMDHSGNHSSAMNYTTHNNICRERNKNQQSQFQSMANVNSCVPTREVNSNIKNCYGWSFSMYFDSNTVSDSNDLVFMHDPPQTDENFSISPQKITSCINNSYPSAKCYSYIGSTPNLCGATSELSTAPALRLTLPSCVQCQNTNDSCPREFSCSSPNSPVIPVPPLSPYCGSFQYFSSPSHTSLENENDNAALSINLSKRESPLNQKLYQKPGQKNIISTRLSKQLPSKPIDPILSIPDVCTGALLQSQKNSCFKDNHSSTKTLLQRSWDLLIHKMKSLGKNSSHLGRKTKISQGHAEDLEQIFEVSKLNPRKCDPKVTLTELMMRFQLEIYVPVLLEHEICDIKRVSALKDADLREIGIINPSDLGIRYRTFGLISHCSYKGQEWKFCTNVCDLMLTSLFL